MPLIVSLGFPTERYVAAGMVRRDEAEWPPHPARFILGLLATHYRGEASPRERAALQWLCEQPPPEILLPRKEHCSWETMKGVFVPQNPSKAVNIKHPRKERCFSAVVLPPGQATILFHWPCSDPPEPVRFCLASLVSRLPRYGHSSSLVTGELLDTLPKTPDTDKLTPLPQDSPQTPDHRLRVPWSGLLESAEKAYAANERETEIAAAIERRDAAARRGRPLEKFEATPRGRFDPRHASCGYVLHLPDTTVRGPWDGGFVALRQTGGDRLGLETTWQATAALHKTLLDRWSRAYPGDPVPAWISGHEAGSGPTTPSRACHLAMFPLAHVGCDNAKGHLLGMAFAIPRPDVALLDRQPMRHDWRRMMNALFGGGPLELAPSDGAWKIQLQPDDGESGKSGLAAGVWTRPSRLWASVTPMILDRHPKPSLKKDPAAWLTSCRSIIAEACQRTGLPEPEKIHPGPQSIVEGTPPAPAFPHPAVRPGRPQRFHIHAIIRFSGDIAGPVLLGAGRYRGYGLFRPCFERI